jgi:hypothetical protein
MKTRLALVACRRTSESAWTLSKGNETGIRILFMGKGEYVKVEIEVGELKDSVIFDTAGVFPLPWKRFDRYRVTKHADDGVEPSPTQVEIVLDAPQSQTWNTDYCERPDG